MVESSEGFRALAALSAQGVTLPRGRLVQGDEGDDDRPALWVSDGPASGQLWAALRSAHEHSGLWPMLLDSLHGDARRPWDDGELWPTAMSNPADFDPATLLAGWWADYTAIDEDTDNLSPPERRAVTAPYGQRWPGLAAAPAVEHDPVEHAARCATELPAAKPWLRLGLVAAARPSDALSVAGWQGAAYTNDTAELSAVLRSWQERFGTYIIGAGFAELYLSVAAPPTDAEQAISVAAEHFAFCPHNIWQGGAPNLVTYADQLINALIWSFWWD